MPICKITKVADPFTVLNYVLAKEGAEFLHSNCFGRTATQLNQEFNVFIDLYNSNSYHHGTTFAHHTSIGFEPGTQLDKDTKVEIAQRYMELMDFSPRTNQYVLAEHHDTSHPHIHLVVNRVRFDGTTTKNTFYDWRRAEKAMRQIEQEFNLTPVANSWETDVRAPSVAEVRKSRDTGEPIPRVVIQQALDAVMSQCHSLEELKVALKEQDIELVATPRYLKVVKPEEEEGQPAQLKQVEGDRPPLHPELDLLEPDEEDEVTDQENSSTPTATLSPSPSTPLNSNSLDPTEVGALELGSSSEEPGMTAPSVDGLSPDIHSSSEPDIHSATEVDSRPSKEQGSSTSNAKPAPKEIQPIGYSLVFEYEGIKFSATKLGSRYTYRAMEEKWSMAIAQSIEQPAPPDQPQAVDQAALIEQPQAFEQPIPIEPSQQPTTELTGVVPSPLALTPPSPQDTQPDEFVPLTHEAEAQLDAVPPRPGATSPSPSDTPLLASVDSQAEVPALPDQQTDTQTRTVLSSSTDVTVSSPPVAALTTPLNQPRSPEKPIQPVDAPPDDAASSTAEGDPSVPTPAVTQSPPPARLPQPSEVPPADVPLSKEDRAPSSSEAGSRTKPVKQPEVSSKPPEVTAKAKPQPGVTPTPHGASPPRTNPSTRPDVKRPSSAPSAPSAQSVQQSAQPGVGSSSNAVPSPGSTPRTDLSKQTPRPPVPSDGSHQPKQTVASSSVTPSAEEKEAAEVSVQAPQAIELNDQHRQYMKSVVPVVRDVMKKTGKTFVDKERHRATFKDDVLIFTDDQAKGMIFKVTLNQSSDNQWKFEAWRVSDEQWQQFNTQLKAQAAAQKPNSLGR